MVPVKRATTSTASRSSTATRSSTPLWDAVAEVKGIRPPSTSTAIDCAAGLASTFVLTQMQGFRHIWGQLTFGGVFDRFPKLTVVFVEGGISWVASMIHDAIYNSFPTAMNPKLAHAPSWYWFNHCYATFMTDPAGLELLLPYRPTG